MVRVLDPSVLDTVIPLVVPAVCERLVRESYQSDSELLELSEQGMLLSI